MLLSKDRQFIFIHVYKNAGSSIRQALRPHTVNLRRQCLRRLLRKPRFQSGEMEPFDRHSTALEIAQKLGRERFRKYFTFAFVRNPWDWQVSLYTYTLKKESHPRHEFVKTLGSFDSYIRWRCTSHPKLQKDFVCDKHGDVIIDFVGRFERLEDDFHEICSRIGVSASLPKKNVSNTKPYRDFYTNETQQLVKQAFAPDITLFDYKF